MLTQRDKEFAERMGNRVNKSACWTDQYQSSHVIVILLWMEVPTTDPPHFSIQINKGSVRVLEPDPS